jgi:hypothetical protein
MNDRLKEQIKYETEVSRFTALLFVAVGGGTLGLLLGTLTLWRSILATAGGVTTLALAITLWHLDRRIRALIAQMKEPV